MLTLSEIAGPLQGRLPTPRPREGTYRGGCSSKEIMKQLPAFFVALVLAGCSAIPFAGEDDTDDFRVPLVCLPKHTQLPCTHGVEEGVGYRFNLQTHCGIEWAYFNGRYWVPNPMIDAPSHWAAITAGTMVLERPGLLCSRRKREGALASCQRQLPTNRLAAVESHLARPPRLPAE